MRDFEEIKVKTLGIDHIGLSVYDLDKTVGFFVECLGWNVFGGQTAYPSIYVTDGNCKVTLWKINADKFNKFDRHLNVGLHHIALKVATRKNLDILFEAVANWAEVKVEFSPEFSGNGPKVHFMISEPCGNRIEFSYDPR